VSPLLISAPERLRQEEPFSSQPGLYNKALSYIILPKKKERKVGNLSPFVS
jgi:hypothetical protein